LSATQTALETPVMAALKAAGLLRLGDVLTVAGRREFCKLIGMKGAGGMSHASFFAPPGPYGAFIIYFSLAITSQTFCLYEF